MFRGHLFGWLFCNSMQHTPRSRLTLIADGVRVHVTIPKDPFRCIKLTISCDQESSQTACAMPTSSFVGFAFTNHGAEVGEAGDRSWKHPLLAWIQKLAPRKVSVKSFFDVIEC